MRLSIAPALLLVALVLTDSAEAQEVLYAFDGDAAYEILGRSVSGAGDVNGDGFDDLIVGAPWVDNNGHNSGSARVFSGVDGAVLFIFDGDSPDDVFGSSVSGAGDVNGDGFDDLVGGAPWDDDNGNLSGSARVFSGVDGTVLFTFDGDSSGDVFGSSVSGAGDVNGDGFDDLIIGASQQYFPRGVRLVELPTGYARIFSGVDGAVLYTFDGDSSYERFGGSVSGAGDVNGDGFDDVIVGAIGGGANNGGYARAFSGVDGTVLYTFDGDSSNDFFGISVSGAGDVNGDGFDDMIVGAWWDSSTGSAWVFSGADGGTLFTFYGDSPNDSFGDSVSGAGDVNGDGFDDVIVGACGDSDNGSFSGSARVFSGVDGATLFTIYGDSALDFFCEVSGAGDVNGDGFDDLIVGAPHDDTNGTSSGRATVFSGCNALGIPYCSPAVDNSSGLPGVIRACGSSSVAENRFLLSAGQLPPNQFGYFLASETQGFVPNPGGSQGNLCLGGTIGRFAKEIQSSGPSGVFGIAVDLTDMPAPAQQVVLPGETWNFQAWFRDKNPDTTSNFTDAVSTTFL